jgi:hypothetical protein
MVLTKNTRLKMLFFTAIYSVYSANQCFSFVKYFSNIVPSSRLNNFPVRRIAYKIGILCAQIGFFWMGVNSLIICAGSIYSIVNRHSIFDNSNSFFMKALILSHKVALGVIVMSLPFGLYAREWQF